MPDQKAESAEHQSGDESEQEAEHQSGDESEQEDQSKDETHGSVVYDGPVPYDDLKGQDVMMLIMIENQPSGRNCYVVPVTTLEKLHPGILSFMKKHDDCDSDDDFPEIKQLQSLIKTCPSCFEVDGDLTTPHPFYDSSKAICMRRVKLDPHIVGFWSFYGL